MNCKLAFKLTKNLNLSIIFFCERNNEKTKINSNGLFYVEHK